MNTFAAKSNTTVGQSAIISTFLHVKELWGSVAAAMRSDRSVLHIICVLCTLVAWTNPAILRCYSTSAEQTRNSWTPDPMYRQG
jgi:hypothetical protein